MKLIDFSFIDCNGKKDTLFINPEYVTLIQLNPDDKDITGIGLIDGTKVEVNHPIGEVISKLVGPGEKKPAGRII